MLAKITPERAVHPKYKSAKKIPCQPEHELQGRDFSLLGLEWQSQKGIASGEERDTSW